MNRIRTFHDVSASLIVLSAMLYVTATLAFRSGVIQNHEPLVTRILTLPHAALVLSYGGSGLFLQLANGGRKDHPRGIMILIGCVLLFGVAALVNVTYWLQHPV